MEFEEVHIKVKVKAKNEFKSKFDFESEFTMHIIPGIPPQKTHPLTYVLIYLTAQSCRLYYQK